MATATVTAAGPARPDVRPDRTLQVAGGLAFRWLLLLGATVVAFHRTIASVLDDFAQGSGLQYVPAVWVYALVAAIWVHHRAARSLDIHDRETDVIVGLLCSGFGVLSASLLGEPLSGVYYLWRIDLLMMYVVALGASVILFGLRRTLYYRWAWLTLLLGWPLVGRLVVYAIGSGQAVSLAILHLVAVVVLQLVLRRPGERFWFLAPALSAVVGFGLLPLLDLSENPNRLVVPALVACAIGLVRPAADALGARLARDPSGVRRSVWPVVRPPVVRRPWGATIALALITLVGAISIPPPPLVIAPVAVPVAPNAVGPGPITPPGWAQISVVGFPEPAQLFGSGATWQRHTLKATTVAPEPGAIDPQGRERDVVVDVLTTRRPRSLVTFPAVVTYPMGRLSLSSNEEIPLRAIGGVRVVASVDSAVDTRRQLTWTMVSFTIELPSPLATTDPVLLKGSNVYQRITLIAVDDHDPGAPFPEPTNALLDSIRAAATHIVRGSTGGGSAGGVPKDHDLLLALAHQILIQRQAGSQ